MSIATEIQRLQSAKADIKTAIENKGVTVGDGTLDTFAEKILEISGTDYPSNIIAINGGTWTQATSLGSGGALNIEHGLTDIPDIIVITSDVFDVKPSGYNLANLFYEKAMSTMGYGVYYNGAITTRGHLEYGSASQGITAVDNTKFTITTAGNRQLGAGVTYSWIAVSFTEGIEVDPSYEYNQGYEDGKNSVVQIDRYLKTAQFTSLNMFGKSEVVFNFDNIANSLGNLFYCDAEEKRNNTVEHLTINCPTLVTSISQMLYCQYPYTDVTLKRLTLNVDTQNCSNFRNAFTHQRALEIIDGKPLDYSSATASNINGFSNCVALVEVRFVANSIKYSISFANCSNLSAETIQSIIDGLADLTGSTAQTLTLHKDVGDKLTETQKATITSKNWELVY